MPSSDDEMSNGEDSEDDAAPKLANVKMPKNMPDAANGSSSDSDDDKVGFLSNTMSLIKDKDEGESQNHAASSIAADLDKLFGSKF